MVKLEESFSRLKEENVNLQKATHQNAQVGGAAQEGSRAEVAKLQEAYEGRLNSAKEEAARRIERIQQELSEAVRRAEEVKRERDGIVLDARERKKKAEEHLQAAMRERDDAVREAKATQSSKQAREETLQNAVRKLEENLQAAGNQRDKAVQEVKQRDEVIRTSRQACDEAIQQALDKQSLENKRAMLTLSQESERERARVTELENTHRWEKVVSITMRGGQCC